MTNWYGLRDNSDNCTLTLDITGEPRVYMTAPNKPVLVLNNGDVLTEYGDIINPQTNDVENSLQEYNYTSYVGYDKRLFLQKGNDIYTFAKWAAYDPAIFKYDWSSHILVSVASLEETKAQYQMSYSVKNGNGYYMAGLKDDTYYIWNTDSGTVVTAQTNGKLANLGFNVQTDVDIIDMKNNPKEGLQFEHMCIGADDELIFYDKSTSSIRIIRKSN